MSLLPPLLNHTLHSVGGGGGGEFISPPGKGTFASLPGGKPLILEWVYLELCL